MVGLQRCIARILSVKAGKQSTVGSGFLAATDIVLTCEHVVRAALGHEWSPDEQGAELTLLVSNEEACSAKVEKADPDRDIAVLRLDKPLSKTSPARLVILESPYGHQFRTCGFTRGDFRWGKGFLYEEDFKGRIQIKSEDVRRGFSGAPVWVGSDIDGGVAGMIVQIDIQGEPYAWCIPTRELFQFANSDSNRIPEGPKKVWRLDKMSEDLALRGLREFDGQPTGPFFAIALGIESLKLMPNLYGDQLVRKSLSLLPRIIARLESEPKQVWIKSVAINPDKRFVAAGDIHGRVCVWNIETGQQIWSRSGTRAITQVLFDPDGRLLAFGNEGGDLEVLEVKSGRMLFSQKCRDRVASIDFSPDSRLIACGSWDRTIRIWDINGGEKAHLVGHTGRVLSVAFHPTEALVASGSTDCTVRVWNIETKKEMYKIQHEDEVSFMAFSPEGNLLVIRAGEGMLLYDTATWKEKDRIRINGYGEPASIVICSEERFVVASAGQVVQVWDVTTKPKQERARMIHMNFVESLALSPDGKWVVSGEDKGNVTVWESFAFPEIEQISIGSPVDSLAICSDGLRIAGGIGSEIRIWENKVRGWQRRSSLRLEDMVLSLAFSPSGKWLAVGGMQGVKIWETDYWEDKSWVPSNGKVRSIAFGSKGSCIFVGNENGIIVWDAIKQQFLRENGKVIPYSLVFHPSNRLIVGDALGEIQILDAETLSLEKSWKAHAGPITALAISHTCKQFIASGSYDNKVRVWDIETRQLLSEMEHNAMEHDTIRSVDFSPDGQWIVSASDDKTARVWDAVTGQEVVRMTHSDRVILALFSPDGRWVISGSADGTVQVWPWRPEDLIAEACRRLPRNLTQEEWARYVGPEVPYRPTCPNLPVPGD